MRQLGDDGDLVSQMPDPDPHAPNFTIPAGACDTHAILFGALGLYPLQVERSYTPVEAPLESYRRVMQRLKLQRAVLVQPSPYGADNRCMLDALARHRNALRGIAVLPPGVSDEELERVAHIGVRGLRFNIVYKSGVQLDDLETLAERIEPLGWHLELLISAADLPKLAPRLADLPVEVVIEAIGSIPAAGGINQPGFKALLKLLRSGRCWVKLAGVYRISAAPPAFRDADPLVRALIETDPTRIVWGSGWPHPAYDGLVPNDGDLLNLLESWAPNERLRHLILVDNPARLYGFDDLA